MIVKLVVQVGLLPTPVQAAALKATLRACNQAATWASEVAFEHGEFKNFTLCKRELWRRGAPPTAPAPPPQQRAGAGRKRGITASDARCASQGLQSRVVDRVNS
ncbi:hypothetical protein GCM10010377_35620 [Streptomyces viridiviolaceus]|nr:hypothetical protein GCM10010377_35620 [Streptomyces viridiviolaceus]